MDLTYSRVNSTYFYHLFIMERISHLAKEMNETKPSNKDLFYKRLMWDYDIPAGDVRAVLWGEKDKAGHYDAHGLFKKAIESYSWFIILDLIPLPRIKELLTDFDLITLRDKKLTERYAFIKAQLEELV